MGETGKGGMRGEVGGELLGEHFFIKEWNIRSSKYIFISNKML